MITRSLFKKCKKLSDEYSTQVDNYDTRVNWTSKQASKSEYDEELLAMMDFEIRKTRSELEDKLLVLDTRLARD